jgi:hypothetical protein
MLAVVVAMAVVISAVTALTPSRTQVSVVTGRGLTTSLPHSRSKSDNEDGGGTTTKAVLESQRMSLTRRMVLLQQLLLFSTASAASVANAAETIGKDENCDVASCVGVWDGCLVLWQPILIYESILDW